ncbi:hypothetical protein B7494_g5509 [Chlorociboria aeruginascens]|nr:hypothetical protein B7494_g5509 [Chlorociboria aeruginascens]
MSDIAKRANNALSANPNIFNYPVTSDIHITTHGSDIYWAFTAVMASCTLAFIALSFRIDPRNRVFHYITAAITLVASITYFTMASNLGYAAILVEFQRNNPVVAGYYRQIFYVRYIDRFITTPLLLLDVLLSAGMPWPTILYTILMGEVMVVTSLVGALVASSYKWGYFVFATVTLFFVAFNVCYVGSKHARALGAHIHRTYIMVSRWTIMLWFIYPIAWGLCEGGNIISPDSEAIFYGVLDFLTKPCFGALLLIGHRNIEPRVFGLQIRDYDDDIPNEKPVGHNPTNNGVDAVQENKPAHEDAAEAATVMSGARPHATSNP